MILFVVEANLSAVVAEQETLVEQGMSELMAVELSETARTAVNAFVGPAVWQSLLAAAAGLALVVLGVVSDRRGRSPVGGLGGGTGRA